MSIAIGSVIGWPELLLCTALWSAVSAQIDTGEDDDPTGDDSAGLGDPTGDDAEDGDPTGEDDPGTLVPPPAEQPPPPAVQPPAPSPSAAPEPVSSAAQAPTPPVPSSTPDAATVAASISASTAASSATMASTVTPAAGTSEISSGQSNGGAVAGGVIGALIGVGVLGAIAFFAMRKRKQQQTGRPTRTSGDDLEEFRPQNEEMVGYHAWNAVSSSDMLASSAAYNTPAPPAPPHQYLPNQPSNNRW